MKLNLERDWWFANSVFWIVSGIFIILVRAWAGSLSAGLFTGGLNIIVGIALLQRSRIAFWITLIMATFNFFAPLLSFSELSKDIGILSFTLSMGIALVSLILALMLWQQVGIKANGHRSK